MRGLKIGDLKYYLLFGLACAVFCSMAFLSWSYSIGVTDFNLSLEQRDDITEVYEIHKFHFSYIPLFDMIVFCFSILTISGIAMIFSITKIDDKEKTKGVFPSS